MENVAKLLRGRRSTGFSFEALPPLKGNGIEALCRNIDVLREFDPLYINITTHRSELQYRQDDEGKFTRVSMRTRPGTVAVAAAIQARYGIPAVPHLICSGFSRHETEYALIDLQFLGITNVLALRGDKAGHESRFIPEPNGHAHAIDLQKQINEFNKGFFIDGTRNDIVTGNPFSYGVAGYPEKHDEAPNPEIDMLFLKQKVDAGAEYIVTQMFFDNAKYFDFVRECRSMGINVPIIPALKPLTTKTQLTVLPKVFHVDLPTDLVQAVMAVDDADTDAVRRIGVEWCTQQARELVAAGVPSIHFYSLNATRSVAEVARAIY